MAAVHFQKHTPILNVFSLTERRGEEKKQHKHFPAHDLCDSITLNILSLEQAQLPSNHRSQP